MADNKKIKEPPKASKGDRIYEAGKVATAVGGSYAGEMLGIPNIGAIVTGFYSTFIKPPLTKRTEEWTYSVYQKLLELEDKTEGITLKRLSEKPFFITTFMQALQIALRNHHEEKLESLRNAVINTAKPAFPEDDIYLIFLNWIDVLTRWHIKILNYLNARELEIRDGRIPMKDISIQPIDKVLSNFPELRGKRDFVLQILDDLSDRGLVSLSSSPNIIRENKNFYESYTTDLGKRFMEFISS